MSSLGSGSGSIGRAAGQQQEQNPMTFSRPMAPVAPMAPIAPIAPPMAPGYSNNEGLPPPPPMAPNMATAPPSEINILT